ncbi:MAG: acetamidase/formamidase family protein [Kiritimatiellae bacterium]|nr:acetamidase/formamidase family protein [Kiritimatiellia bacterium]
MQIFRRESIHTHCVGSEWPEFLGEVELGESFVIETERLNGINGPIGVCGLVAGDGIAIHVEQIEILPPFLAPNGGPFFEGMGELVPLEYADGVFFYPNGFRLKAKPSVGNIAVLPAPTERVLGVIKNMGSRPDPNQGWRSVLNDPRGKHCHQDCQALGEGAVLHIKAQVDGGGICAADVHGYISQGEVGFAGIEVAADVQLRVERSDGWLIDWPLVETREEIMVFCSNRNLTGETNDQEYVDLVREAYWCMRKVVAGRIRGTIADANAIVATALDIRNCALYGLANLIQKDGKTQGLDGDVAIVGVLPKSVFANEASNKPDARDGL